MANTTLTGTKVPHRRWPGSNPPATDWHVGCLPLTGRTVVVSGTKVNGEVFARTLSNVSFVPGRLGQHTVVGLDVSLGEVRTFRLATVRTLALLTNGNVVFRGVDLVATIDHHLGLGGGQEQTPVYFREAA